MILPDVDVNSLSPKIDQKNTKPLHIYQNCIKSMYMFGANFIIYTNNDIEGTFTDNFSGISIR